MKIEDLAYRVCIETLNLLEEKYHYRVSDEHKKNIQKEIKENINTFIADAAKPAASVQD
jgi:flagellar basal body-associated protein FliL